MAVDALTAGILRAAGGSNITSATTTNETGIDTLTGSGKNGLWARFIATTSYVTSGATTATFSIEHSDSLGSGYATLASGAIDVATVATGGSGSNTPFTVWIRVPPGSRRYLRAVCVTGGSPTGLGINYQAELSFGKDSGI